MTAKILFFLCVCFGAKVTFTSAQSTKCLINAKIVSSAVGRNVTANDWYGVGWDWSRQKKVNEGSYIHTVGNLGNLKEIYYLVVPDCHRCVCEKQGSLACFSYDCVATNGTYQPQCLVSKATLTEASGLSGYFQWEGLDWNFNRVKMEQNDNIFQNPSTKQIQHVMINDTIFCQCIQYDMLFCNISNGYSENAIWDHWSSWTACSKTCSTGTRTRQRTCFTPKNKKNVGTGKFEWQYCRGKQEEKGSCKIRDCPNSKCSTRITGPMWRIRCCTEGVRYEILKVIQFKFSKLYGFCIYDGEEVVVLKKQKCKCFA